MDVPRSAAALDAGSLAPLDLAGLGLVAVLVVLGIWRGLWWQAVRLAGVLAAVLLARTFAPQLADWILGRWTELPHRLAHGMAWFAVFLGALLVATLLGLFGHRLLHAMQLGLADRVGGGLVGALTGVLLYLAVLIALCQLAPEPFVGRVVAGTYSERIVHTIGDRWEAVIDPAAAQEIQRLLEAGAPPQPAAPSPEGAATGAADATPPQARRGTPARVR